MGRLAPSACPRSPASPSHPCAPRAASAPVHGASCRKSAPTRATPTCHCATPTPSPTGTRRMADSSRRPWLPTMAYAVAALVILLDQLAKHWITVTMHMQPGASIALAPPLLNLTLVLNRGVSFGMFKAGEGTEIIR